MLLNTEMTGDPERDISFVTQEGLGSSNTDSIQRSSLYPSHFMTRPHCLNADFSNISNRFLSNTLKKNAHYINCSVIPAVRMSAWFMSSGWST